MSLKRRTIRVACFMSAKFFAAIFILSAFSGSSLAFNTYEGFYEDSASVLAREASFALPPRKSALLVPSSPKADACMSLLQDSSYAPSASALDRNRRSAGKAAMLSLVFGVRFALSPSEEAVSHDYNQVGPDVAAKHNKAAKGINRSALSVSAYRQCKKQRALQVLSASR